MPPWLRRAVQSVIVTAISTVDSMMNSLGRHRLRPYDYNHLMLYLSHDADAVLRVFRRIPRPNVQCYTTAMNALISSSRPLEAAMLFKEMDDSGISPDRHAFTLLIKIHACHLRRFDSALSFLRLMSHRGCAPDVVTYSVLFTGLCSAGYVDVAWKLFDEMLSQNLAPNVHTFAPFIQNYCLCGNIDDAMKTVDLMNSFGCPPDVVIYNILIQGLCKFGNFDEVEKVIESSQSKDWKPNDVTYSIYIAGLCRAGLIDSALEQLDDMLVKGLRPTTVGLNILLDSVGFHSADGSENLLERCELMGFNLDIVSYNTLMSQFVQCEKWLSVFRVFTNLIKKGVEPDRHSFNILISSSCKAGRLNLALSIFDSRGFTADTVTCNILIHEFYRAEKLGRVGFILSDFGVGNIAPDMISCNTLVDSLCRKGNFIRACNFVRSIGDGYPPEPVSHLAYWLVRCGNTREALVLIEEMLEKGLVIDGAVFNQVIKAFCRKGVTECQEMPKICFMLDKMLGFS